MRRRPDPQHPPGGRLGTVSSFPTTRAQPPSRCTTSTSMRSPGQIAYVGRIGMWSACACGYVTVQGRMRHDRAQATRCGVTWGAVPGRASGRWMLQTMPANVLRAYRPAAGSHLASWRKERSAVPGAPHRGPIDRDGRVGTGPPSPVGPPRHPQGAARLFHRDGRTDLSGTVGARMHHQAVTDDAPPTTVRDRLTAAGLSECRIEQHMTAGRVRIDGELVTDPNRPRRRPRGSLSRRRRAFGSSPT